MAVGLRRRGNPYGATGFFGYDAQDDTQPTPENQFLGFQQVAGVGNEEPTQVEEQNPELIQPMQSEGVPTYGSDESGSGDLPTQDQIERRMKLAQAMIERGQDTSEIHHPLEAIGRAVNQIGGAYMQRKAEDQAKEYRKGHLDFWKKAVGEGSGDIEALAKTLLSSPYEEDIQKGLDIQTQIMLARTKKTARTGKPMEMIKGNEIVYLDPDTGEELKGYGGPRYKPGAGGGGAGGGDGFAPTSQGGNIALPDGRIVLGSFQKGRGWIYRDPDTGEWKDAPAGARQMTTSVGGGLSPQQYAKEKMQQVQDTNALAAMEKYAKQVGGLPQGFQRWANGLSAKFNTFFASPLNRQQFEQLDAQAKQQALLGMLRTTVVGPGVMTEYDAMRVIQAMGGDPASAFQNPEVVAAVLQDLYSRKHNEVQQRQQIIDQSSPYYNEQPGVAGLPPETMSLGNEQQAPAALPPPNERVAGKTTRVVKGVTYVWTGTGWKKQ